MLTCRKTKVIVAMLPATASTDGLRELASDFGEVVEVHRLESEPGAVIIMQESDAAEV